MRHQLKVGWVVMISWKTRRNERLGSSMMIGYVLRYWQSACHDRMISDKVEDGGTRTHLRHGPIRTIPC